MDGSVTNYNVNAGATASSVSIKNETEHKVPKISRKYLDVSFARLASSSVLLHTVLNGVNEYIQKNDDGSFGNHFLKRVVRTLSDLSLRARHMAQYSLHARPNQESEGIEADDIYGDKTHNLHSMLLGNFVHQLNAFVSPYIGIARAFLSPEEELRGFSKLIQTPVKRILNAFDTTSQRLSSLFWNIRRITMALVPYNGGIRTDVLERRSNNIRDIWELAISNVFLRIHEFAKNNLGKKTHRFLDGHLRKFHLDYEQAKRNQLQASHRIGSSKEANELFQEAVDNISNKFAAIKTGHYRDPEGNPKSIGEAEPEHAKWYIKSKMLSQILGLPVGISSAAINTVSLVAGILGDLLGIDAIRHFSQNLTDKATGLQSLLYISSEVPANLDKAIMSIDPKHKQEFMELSPLEKITKSPQFIVNILKDKNFKASNLKVFIIGALAMASRISYLMPRFIREKLWLDNPLLKPLFFWFFSENRRILHTDEFENMKKDSSISEIKEAEKHKHWIHIARLIPRVLSKDKDVYYEVDIEREKAAASLALYEPSRTFNTVAEPS